MREEVLWGNTEKSDVRVLKGLIRNDISYSSWEYFGWKGKEDLENRE